MDGGRRGGSKRIDVVKISAHDEAVLKVCDYLDVPSNRQAKGTQTRGKGCCPSTTTMEPHPNTIQPFGGPLNAFGGAQGVNFNDLNFTQAQNVHYNYIRPLGERISRLINEETPD